MVPISAKCAVRVAAAACFTVGAGASQAFTVSQPDVQSYLTQPLRARAHIELAPGEPPPTHIGLATAEDSRRYGLPAQSLTNLSVRTVNVANGVNVFIESTSPVSEPMFTVLLDVHSGSLRSLREFTVLLDPPSLETLVADTGPTVTAPTAVPTPVPVPAAAPRPASVAEVSAALPAPKKRAAHGSRGHDRAAANAEPSSWTPSLSPNAAEETYGPVAANETLSDIAQIYRPAPTASLSSVIARIVAANPEVTLGRDNFLPEGATLKIPHELAPYRNSPWSGIPGSVFSRKNLKYVSLRVNAAPRFQLAMTLGSLHANPSLAAVGVPAPAPAPPVEAAAPVFTATSKPKAPTETAPEQTTTFSSATSRAADSNNRAATATAAEEVAPKPQEVAAPSAPEHAEPTTMASAAVSGAEPKIETTPSESVSRGSMALIAVLSALAFGLLGWARKKELFNRARQPALMAAPILVPPRHVAAPVAAKAAAVNTEISPDERVVLLKQAYAARGKRFRDLRSA